MPAQLADIELTEPAEFFVATRWIRAAVRRGIEDSNMDPDLFNVGMRAELVCVTEI